jgi:hypothetical protein
MDLLYPFSKGPRGAQFSGFLQLSFSFGNTRWHWIESPNFIDPSSCYSVRDLEIRCTLSRSEEVPKLEL